MPPDLPSEQALVLKKRARRRLVGAIALVLLMIIILPRILEDRAALVPQEAIKISMSSASNDPEVVAISDNLPVPTLESKQVVISTDPQLPPVIDAAQVEVPVSAYVPIITKSENADDLIVNKVESKANKVENDKHVTLVQEKAIVNTESAKVTELKTNEVNGSKISDVNVTQAPKVVEEKVSKKSPTNFTVQVGVYSDANNVKYLQNKIKEMGLSSHTEKVMTPKGEKIRIKTGSFSSRADAVRAQFKLQKIGLSGMVVGNE